MRRVAFVVVQKGHPSDRQVPGIATHPAPTGLLGCADGLTWMTTVLPLLNLAVKSGHQFGTRMTFSSCGSNGRSSATALRSRTSPKDELAVGAEDAKAGRSHVRHHQFEVLTVGILGDFTAKELGNVLLAGIP
ncbi:hypothetical protein BX283_7559 [Streptomyces sp. TLI_146]|nr:hypothetical protein BX283_7559 [Streptomyces sp. TLI_146]